MNGGEAAAALNITVMRAPNLETASSDRTVNVPIRARTTDSQ